MMSQTIFGILAFFSCSCAFADFSGKVTGIVDGDTIRVLDENNIIHKVRLSEIDTPEMGQPFGKQAKLVLSNLIFKKTALIQTSEIDRYGRDLGTVYVDGKNINLEMVRQGYAWAYRFYLKDQSYILLESLARDEKRGLWIEKTQVAPWEWRRKN